MMIDTQYIVTVKQAADTLNLPKNTLHYHLGKPDFPAPVLQYKMTKGSFMLFDVRDVRAWFDARP